jgi:hypothetical protein
VADRLIQEAGYIVQSTTGTGARREGSSNLPDLTAVEIKRVRFDPPLRFYSEGRLVSMSVAIELLVRTAAALPVLDVPPVLFVGDVRIDDGAMVGQNAYRFRAFEIGRLKRGARIALGWPYAPETKVPSRFVFEPPDIPVA